MRSDIPLQLSLPDIFWRWCCLAALATVGCGRPAPTVTVDDAPFRTAVAEYLQANNMAMKLKEIKQPPAIEGEKATMTASLTHEQLGGPSVTWQFEFAQQPDGSWRVVKHQQ